jgi:hypothetical protein
MHPTLQYQLARTMAADRVDAARRCARSGVTAREGVRLGRHRQALRFLASPTRSLARRSTPPAGFHTEP